jgi:protein-S-isoprenylcysteine O-methyltransferase Ste14
MFILYILVILLIPLLTLAILPYLFVHYSLAVWPEAAGVWQMIALVLLLLGLFLIFWVSFAHARHGKSTPVLFSVPKKFVAVGPYTFSRNPMYVGMLVVLVGEALLLQAPWMLVFTALIFIIFHLYVKFEEEPLMIQRFGASYQEYMKKVPRWLSLKRIQ